jgi:hypothetical protein
VPLTPALLIIEQAVFRSYEENRERRENTRKKDSIIPFRVFRVFRGCLYASLSPCSAFTALVSIVRPKIFPLLIGLLPF